MNVYCTLIMGEELKAKAPPERKGKKKKYKIKK